MTRPLTSPSRVAELLKTHGLRPDRSFGQNFLVDASALAAISAAAGLDRDATVVEFGPGLGVLTVELAAHAGHVLAVELDGRLLPALGETTASLDNVTILHQDALKFDYSVLPEGSALVANLPYNVATPLIMNAVESGRISRLVVMVQREVAQRMQASVGDAGYGAWSVILGYHAEAEIVRDVAPGCFFPPPEVTSSIVRLDVRAGVEPDRQLFALVHDAFRHRRKTLRNNLGRAGHAGKLVDIALARMGLDSRIRAEELSLKQFQELLGELRSVDDSAMG